MNITDIMIHIKETLSSEERSTFEDELRDIDGVIAPRFSTDKIHLLVVAYNPDRTNSAAFLNKAQAAGYTARLIGG